MVNLLIRVVLALPYLSRRVRFTLDMARALAERLKRESGNNREAQTRRAYQLCYSRPATRDEVRACLQLVEDHGLAALCRVLLNTSEMIYVR